MNHIFAIGDFAKQCFVTSANLGPTGQPLFRLSSLDLCSKATVVSMDNNNVAASLAACGTMQLFTAPRAMPLLWTPTLISWGVDSNRLLALAFCTLHESNAQLMPPRFPWSFPAAVGVSQYPLRQFFATPAENPANFHKLCLACPYKCSRNTVLCIFAMNESPCPMTCLCQGLPNAVGHSIIAEEYTQT